MQASGGRLVSNVSDDERLVGRSKEDDGEDSKKKSEGRSSCDEPKRKVHKRSKMEMAGRTFFLFIQTQQ